MNDILLFVKYVLEIAGLVKYNLFYHVSKRFITHTCEGKVLRICGNGSSLNSQKLNEATNVEYMVVNRHVVSANYVEIKPSFYVLADKHFFNTNEGKDIVNQIFLKTKWNMILFVPYGFDKSIEQNNNEFITIQPFSQCPLNSDSKLAYYLYDNHKAMPKLQNVINGALMLAIWLGFKNIELYGVEHSWTKLLFVDDDNNVCLTNEHFYDKAKVDYRKFSDIQDGERTTISKCLRNYSLMFEAYLNIAKYARYKGCNIINCTPNSFIDAFPRKK